MSLLNVSNGIVEPRRKDHHDIIIERNLNKCDWLKAMLAKLIGLEALDLVEEENELREFCVNLIRKYQKCVLVKYGKTVARARTKGAFAVNLQEMTMRLKALVRINSLDEVIYLKYFTRLYRLYLEIAFNATLPGAKNIKKEDHLFNILDYGRNLFIKYPDRILDAFLTATLEPQDRIDMLYFATTFPRLFTSPHEAFYKFLIVARVIQCYYHSERAIPEVRDKLFKVCQSVISTHTKISPQFLDFLWLKRPSKITRGLQMTPVDIVNSLNSKRGVKEAQGSIYQIPEEEENAAPRVVFSIDRNRADGQSSSSIQEFVLDMNWNGNTVEPELQEVKNDEEVKLNVGGGSQEEEEEEDMFADVERPPEDPKDDNVDVATAPIPPPAPELEEESDIEVIGERFLPNSPGWADEEESEPEGSYDSSENPPNYDEDSSNSDSEDVEEEQEETEESSEEDTGDSSEEGDNKSEQEEPEGNSEVGDKSEKDEVDSDDDVEKVKAFSPMKIMPSPTQEGGSQGRSQEIEGIVSKFTEAIAKSNIPGVVVEPSPKVRELRTRAAPKGVQLPKVKQQPAPKVKEPPPKVIQPRPTSSMLSTLVPAKREAPALRTPRATAANKNEEEEEMKKDKEIPAKKGKMTRKKAEPTPKEAPIAKSEQIMIAPPKKTAMKRTTPKNAAPAGLATKKARGKPKKNEVKKTIKSPTMAKEEAPKPDKESTEGPTAEKKEEVASTSKGKGKGKKGKNDAPESATITTRSLRSKTAREGSIARLTY